MHQQSRTQKQIQMGPYRLRVSVVVGFGRQTIEAIQLISRRQQ